MKHNIRFFLLVIFLVQFFISPIYCQNQIPADSKRDTSKLKVYMDCWDCDFVYFRKNLPYIDFVRDPKQSDLHLMVTEQRTASNGREYGLNFLGYGIYSDLNYKLTTTAPPSEPDLDTWNRLLKTTQLGMMPFLSRTEEMANLHISYQADSLHSITDQLNYDPWNYWVFRINLSSNFEFEESQNEQSARGSFRMDRITEKLKFRSDIVYYRSLETYEDDNDFIESVREDIDSDIEIVYSLGPRWSAGLFTEFSSSTYENIQFGNRLGPAIEYNIFPWDRSDRKIFSLGYHLQSHYFNYAEPTIYNETEELRASESLRLTLILRQPWGEVETRLEGSHYFHDISMNRVNLESEVSVNVARGLSFYMRLNTSLINDQIYLPAGEVTLEELLLRQQQLETSYEVSAHFGIAFTFGSIYNNIVNQRLYHY